MLSELENQIIDLIDQHEYEDAYDLIQEYLDQFGDTEFYYFALSDVLLSMEQYEETVDLMLEALNSGYDNQLLYERLGDSYFGLDDFEHALEWYLKVDLGVDDPELIHIIYMIGMCYFHLENYEKAIHYFEDALLEDESDELYYNSAIAYLSVGNINRAKEYFEKVSHDENLLLPICRALCLVGAFADAQSFISRLSSYEQYYFDVCKAEYYEIEEEYDMAIQWMSEAIKKHPSDHLKLHLALLHDSNRSKKTAKLIMREIIDNDVITDDTVIGFVHSHLEALAYLDLSIRTQVKYLKKLEEYAHDDPHLYSLLLNYALDHDLKDYQDYLIYDFMVVEGESFSLRIYIDSLIVSVHIVHFRYEEALDLLEGKFFEKNDLYYHQLVLCLYNLQKYQEIIDLYDQIMPSGRAALMLMDCFVQLQDFEGFYRVLDDMYDVDVDSVEDIDIFYDAMDDLYQDIDDALFSETE